MEVLQTARAPLRARRRSRTAVWISYLWYAHTKCRRYALTSRLQEISSKSFTRTGGVLFNISPMDIPGWLSFTGPLAYAFPSTHIGRATPLTHSDFLVIRFSIGCYTCSTPSHYTTLSSKNNTSMRRLLGSSSMSDVA